MLQINESTLVGIADAIRGKEGTTEPLSDWFVPRSLR